jgi:hypothetical protein
VAATGASCSADRCGSDKCAADQCADQDSHGRWYCYHICNCAGLANAAIISHANRCSWWQQCADADRISRGSSNYNAHSAPNCDQPAYCLANLDSAADIHEPADTD